MVKSTQNAASPQTQSFGPHRQLVAELLECGETEIAFEYFELCEAFWTSVKKQLENWREKIRGGDNPLKYLLRENRVFFDQIAKPRSTYKASRFSEAESASESLLQMSDDHKMNSRHYGYAVHVANVVLGLIFPRLPYISVRESLSKAKPENSRTRIPTSLQSIKHSRRSESTASFTSQSIWGLILLPTHQRNVRS